MDVTEQNLKAQKENVKMTQKLDLTCLINRSHTVLKIWAKPGFFFVNFRPFLNTMKNTAQHIKRTGCAWDSNPVLKNARCRPILLSKAAPQNQFF